VLGNDTDVDSPTISAIPQTLATQFGGTVEVFADGTFSYDPRPSAQLRALEANQTLDDTFTYSVTDNQAGFASTTVIVTVSGVPGPPYQNADLHTDVTGDGVESPIDALTVINFINLNGPGVIPPGTPTPPYLDVNGDGMVTALDVLEIVGRLNNIAAGLGEAEGESAGATAVQTPLPGADAYSVELVSLGMTGVNDLPSQIEPPASRVDRPLAAAIPAVDSPDGLWDRTESAAAADRSVFDDLPLDTWDLEDALSGIVDELEDADVHEAATDEVLGQVFG